MYHRTPCGASRATATSTESSRPGRARSWTSAARLAPSAGCVAGAGRARPTLHGSRVRPAAGPLRRPPRVALGGRWANQRRKPAAPVLAPPSRSPQARCAAPWSLSSYARGWSTAWVWVTLAMSRSVSSRTEVSTTIVVEPRCRTVAVAVTAPPFTAPRKFVLDSIVDVAIAPSGRFENAARAARRIGECHDHAAVEQSVARTQLRLPVQRR